MYARTDGHLRTTLFGRLCLRDDLNIKPGLVASYVLWPRNGTGLF